MTNLDANAKAALGAWLDRSTFHTGHANDEEMSYKFVNALWNCNRSLIDEQWLREILAREIEDRHGKFDPEYIKAKIAKWARNAQTIMDYHCAVEEVD